MRSKSAAISAVVYTGVATAGALAFLLITTFTGDYGAAARFGGAAWVFLLSIIILMPTVPGVVRRLLGEVEDSTRREEARVAEADDIHAHH